MLFDIALVLLLVLGTYLGWRRGFIGSFFDILGVVIGLMAAISFYKQAGALLASMITLSPVIANVTVFIGLVILFHFVWNFLKNLIMSFVPKFIGKGMLNKMGGLIIGFGYTLLYLSLLSWLFLRYPVPQLYESISNSRLLPVFASLIEAPLSKATNQIDRVVQDIATIRLSPAVIGETKELNIPYTNLEIVEAKEREMIDLVNEERQKRGLSTLTYSAELTEVGRKHAEDMWEKQYFAHTNLENKTPFDRIRDSGIPFISAGENLALAPTASTAHVGLMNSPGHRANILHSDFGRIGVGAISGGPVSGILFVQVFTN